MNINGLETAALSKEKESDVQCSAVQCRCDEELADRRRDPSNETDVSTLPVAL